VRSSGGNGGGSGFVIPGGPYPLRPVPRYSLEPMDRVSVDTRVPGVALVSLVGEHELYSALKLQERIDALIADGLSIVIDLTEAAFLDSSIVGVLLRAQKLAAASHVDYTVVLSKSTGQPVRRMFEITGLSDILPIVERDAAII
jgi:anti-anti-sigma factor